MASISCTAHPRDSAEQPPPHPAAPLRGRHVQVLQVQRGPLPRGVGAHEQRVPALRPRRVRCVRHQAAEVRRAGREVARQLCTTTIRIITSANGTSTKGSAPSCKKQAPNSSISSIFITYFCYPKTDRGYHIEIIRNCTKR